MQKKTWKEYYESLTPDDVQEQRAWGASAGSQLAASFQDPNETEPHDTVAKPPLDDETRLQKQLEILNHFGTIDFDPDYDPLKLRQLERDRMKRQ